MKTEYVIVYAEAVKTFNDGAPPQIILTLKDRPDWQAGHYNLPGGKMEFGETPEAAAIRELGEETGLHPANGAKTAVVGRIEGEFATVYCVRTTVVRKAIKPREGETEVSQWFNTWSVLNLRIMPNLNVIIPLMQSGVKGWVINDKAPDWGEKSHTFTITVPMKN